MSSFVEPHLVEVPLAEELLDEEILAEERLAEERLAEERFAEERLAEERFAEERFAEELLAEELLAERLEEERLAEEEFEENRLAEEFFDEEGFIEGSPDKAAQVLVDLTRKPIGHKVITMLQKCGGFRNEALIDSIRNVGIYDDDDYMDDYEDFYYPRNKVVVWNRYDDDFNVDDDW